MAGNPNPNPNPNPTTLPPSSNPRPLTLTLTLTLILTLALAAADPLTPSPSPSPFPSPFFPPRTPPKQTNSAPSGLPASPSGSPLRIIPPPHHPRVPAALLPPGRDLNFGQKMGLLFAGVAGAMQLVFGGFLAVKRWQLGRLERGYRRKGASSAAPLT